MYIERMENMNDYHKNISFLVANLCSTNRYNHIIYMYKNIYNMITFKTICILTYIIYVGVINNSIIRDICHKQHN